MRTSQVTAVLALANTRHGPAALLAEGDVGEAVHDHLADGDEARRYLASRGLVVPRRPPTAGQLRRLRQVRDAAAALADGGSERDVDQVAPLLARTAYRLTLGGEIVPAADGWEGVIASLLHGFVELLERRDRVRLCANPGCRWLFLDESRNHSRIWCDMGTCGSRAKMSRYRERKRGEGTGPDAGGEASPALLLPVHAMDDVPGRHG